MESRNLTMLVDFYELSMANGYFANGMQDKIAYFDMFFRKVPDNGGFAIMAGLRQLVDYLKNLKFTQKDLELFRKKGFCEDFIRHKRTYKSAASLE